MSRLILIAALFLTLGGCGLQDVHWRPSGPNGDTKPPPFLTSPIADGAVSALQIKAGKQATVARATAVFVRSGKAKEYANIEDFMSPLNKAIGSPEATKEIYQALRDAQDARLGREKDGETLDFVRDKSGNPDWEATAKIYDETADGFDRVAKGGK